MAKGKYKRLLDDPDVRRWHESFESEITADNYLRRLGLFCEVNRLLPKDLVVTVDDETRFNLILDFVTRLKKEGRAASYRLSLVKSIRSWLEFRHKSIGGKLRISGAHKTPSLAKEVTPSQDDLKGIFHSADKKARVACALMAHSGVRPQVLGAYRATDGLMIGDFPEMSVTAKGVSFARIPTRIVVREPISKIKDEYFTFLSDEGCEYLKDYLEERLRSGEKLTNDSAVISPKIEAKSGRKFITTTNIGDMIRVAMRKAGVQLRPYVLRDYFATQTMLANSKGLIIREYRVFFMGQRGKMLEEYTTGKNKLPARVVEDMRDAYQRTAKEFLVTTPTAPRKEVERAVDERMKHDILQYLGVSPGTAKMLGMDKWTLEQVQEYARKEMYGAITRREDYRQRVILSADVERYIERGAKFISMLGSEKAVVGLPK